MNQIAIDKVLDSRAKTSQTKRIYKSLYEDMRQYELDTGLSFDEDTLNTLVCYINQKQYTDIMTVNSRLLYIKYYLKEIGKEDQVKGVLAKDFDLSPGMIRQFIPSVDEMYSRFSLVYDPNNGDSIFPLGSFAWMGIPFADAISIQKDEVDLNSGVIMYSGTMTFQYMPIRMRDVMRAYSGVKSVVRDNRKTEMPDGRPEFIYKTVPAGSSRSGRPIQAGVASYWFAQVREAYNKLHTNQISTGYSDILRSGEYYKARELELQGMDWSLPKNGEKLQEVFKTKRIEPTYLRHNYFMYKKAFRLK